MQTSWRLAYGFRTEDPSLPLGMTMALGMTPHLFPNGFGGTVLK